MKKQNEKLDLGTMAMTIALALILFTGNALQISRAADPPANTANQQSTDSPQEVICQYELRLYLDTELKSFRAFMDQHFENKSSTASLLDIAFAKYDEFKTKVYAKYNTYQPQAGTDMMTEGIKGAACLAQVNEALDTAQQMILRKAATTSAVKQTTALIDKYKQINDKLAVMNKTFLNFKSYMDTFSLKVPCYLKDSCNAK
jgi:hypothetical protein